MTSLKTVQINDHSALAGLVWRQLDTTASTKTDITLHAEELAAKEYVTVGDPPACVGFVCDEASKSSRMLSAAALVAASLPRSGTFIILEHYAELDCYWVLVVMEGSVISDTDVLIQDFNDAVNVITSVVEFGVENVMLAGNAIAETELVSTLNLSEDRVVDTLNTILKHPAVDTIKKAKIRKLPGKSHTATFVLLCLLGLVGWYVWEDKGGDVNHQALAEQATLRDQAMAAVNAARSQDFTGPGTSEFMAAAWQLINTYDKHPVGWDFAGLKCEAKTASCYFNYVSDTGLITKLEQYFQLSPGEANIDISGKSIGFSQPLLLKSATTHNSLTFGTRTMILELCQRIRLRDIDCKVDEAKNISVEHAELLPTGILYKRGTVHLKGKIGHYRHLANILDLDWIKPATLLIENTSKNQIAWQLETHYVLH